MAFKIKLTGWPELKDALRHLPETLAAEAAPIVQEAGETTGQQLQIAYPPGELRDRVRVTFATRRFGVRSTVNSASPWAMEWEFGTNNRHTQQGWNRGAEPAHPDRGLLTIARRQGRIMNHQLAALVEGAGFTVRQS
jgi:hypothetical protein